MKFTEQGGVVISVSVERDVTPANDLSLRFSVRDTGCGIPYDKQHMIFEAFAQADGSATRRQGGWGS